MGFTSILDLRDNPNKDLPRSIFFTDLNLEQIIKEIKINWEEDNTKYYYYFPADKECEDYRREVYKDIKNVDNYSLFFSYVEKTRECREIKAYKEKVTIYIQKEVWQIIEAGKYCDALICLEKEIRNVTFHSEGLIQFREYLQEYVKSDRFIKMNAITEEIRKKLSEFRFVVTYDKDNLVLTEGTVEGTYESFLDECCPERNRNMKSPFFDTVNLTQLEQELVKIIMKKEPEFFEKIEEFHKEFPNYEDEVIHRFGSEITYYLSFNSFQRKMEDAGFSFTTPTVDEDRPMMVTELYDLALACVNMRSDKPVVANSISYEEGESIFVLTGPNQGGKTTFARSLGQMIYFCKMGVDVPAVSANIHYFKDILTHFSVEESVETGRGKLKEELRRLAPMMVESYENTFVIINELFTTAANYDACIMGRNVVEHFIKQNCRGIYVTHLRELSELGNGVVSIRAALDEHRMQNFHIIRSQADDTACAVNQVNKYKLTYDQLKERLS